MAYLYFVTIVLTWSVSFLLMKKAALVFGPLAIGGWRCFSGALVLAAVWRVRGAGWPLARRDLMPLLGIVLVGFLWPYAVQPYLVSRHGSGFIGMTMAFVPLLTILVSIPMLQVRPTSRQLFGVLGGLGFMSLLFADGLKREVPGAHLLLAGTIPLTYALSNTYVKRRFAGVPALPFTLAALFLAGALALPVSWSLPSERMNLGPDFAWAALCLALLGVLGTGMAMFMFYRLVQEQGPLFAGMVTYLVPVGAIFWGWLDGETVTGRQLGGLCGVLAMVAIVQYGAPLKAAAPPVAPALAKAAD
ncbi:MAG: DMT family transporter [Planctomycetota bacterium]|nr:DMT family transporter [Planctomycetota bacterium]